MLVAHTQAGIGQRLRFWHLLMAGLGAETPEVEQRLDSEVKGTIALFGQVLAEGDQFEHV
ncbi:hypothetical protein D3C72_2183150 [compost metagenome]